MNDFDANLIREFRSRPAFYDRNNARFKDKVFTAREWQEISNKLGYDVSLLKDRMLQLRNRYNLEKRRIEQLREENPGIVVESPWPLFDHLHFLSEHIRARRSYKRMLNTVPQQATRMDLQSNGSNSSSAGGGDDVDENGISQLNLHAAAAAAAFPNGYLPVRVKMENVDDGEPNSNGSQVGTGFNGSMTNMHLEAFHQQQQQQQQHQQNNQQNDTDGDESENRSVADNGAFLTAQSAAMLSSKQYAFAQQQQQQQQQQLQLQQQRLHPSAPPPLKIRRIDTLRAASATGSSAINTWIPIQQLKKRHCHSNSSVSTSSHTNAVRPEKLKTEIQPTYATPREQKYAAFGDFVASSLLDLPPVTAMQLIEKFTTEVVKVLIENDETTENEQNSTTAAACNGVAAGTAN